MHCDTFMFCVSELRRALDKYRKTITKTEKCCADLSSKSVFKTAQMAYNQVQEISCVFLSHPQQYFHTKSHGFTDYTFLLHKLSAAESLTAKDEHKSRDCLLLLGFWFVHVGILALSDSLHF